MKDVGHHVARSTIARILKAEGLPPRDGRATPWRTFVAAHWSALVAADVFTTEVWTPRGLVTYYVLFVIDLASRRVQVVGATPHPDTAFVLEALRHATAAEGLLRQGRVLICDRDPKWCKTVETCLERQGLRVIRTPARAPNCNAFAERFVRSIKEECLDRLIVLGERHLRRAVAGVRASLPCGTQSPGTRERADSAARAPKSIRPCAPTATPGGHAELLPPSGLAGRRLGCRTLRGRS